MVALTWSRSGRGRTWHLVRPLDLDATYCGRPPNGQRKADEFDLSAFLDGMGRWPDASCFSCMDVLCGNFPPPRGLISGA